MKQELSKHAHANLTWATEYLAVATSRINAALECVNAAALDVERRGDYVGARNLRNHADAIKSRFNDTEQTKTQLAERLN